MPTENTQLARIRPVQQTIPTSDDLARKFLEVELDPSMPSIVRFLAAHSRMLARRLEHAEKRLGALGQGIQQHAQAMDGKFQGLIEELKIMLGGPQPEQQETASQPEASPLPAATDAAPAELPQAPDLTPSPAQAPKPQTRKRNGGAQ